jgi:hypothetical protein
MDSHGGFLVITKTENGMIRVITSVGESYPGGNKMLLFYTGMQPVMDNL